ncbi:MAG: glycosyltransferase [Roseivirga sp.]|uniref:glycosyltransferase family 4 protein n=1 Tax=Roseivirga sp. TaxID=1964215 RepID=UPI001B29D453|nr:glycosyltransferase [Roseivirga sp.]MBO6660494.1 glycosyltransferase [Roseivirga sp.]MBO6762610.1 glycosyltransferase [Roseivirga sp.]MBO6906769.1 glycosyltransferase [Roseivirga sp.]
MKKKKVFIWGLINYNWSLDINAANMARALDKEKYKVYSMVTTTLPYESIPGVTYFKRRYPDKIWKFICLLRACLICKTALIYRMGEFRVYWWLFKLFRLKTISVLGLTSSIFNREYPRVTSLHALSEVMREECKELGIPIKEKVLINPIRTEPFHQIRKVRTGVLKDIIFIGHDFERKGIDDVIFVAQNTEQLHFHVVGGYMDHQINLKKKLKQGGLTDSFTLYGSLEQPKLLEVVDKCQLHILPSRKEGRPKVAIEAAAAGLPSILYEGYGAEEYIENGQNGFVVKTREQLLEKVRLLQYEEGLLKEMSEKTERLYKKFDLREIVKDYEQLIDSL